MYKVEFKKQAFKFIQNLDKKTQDKLEKIFNSLSENPFSMPYKKIVGFDNMYRIRVGEYRILYTINNGELLIEVIKIANRENFYN